jgi:urease accessory protein
MLEITEKLDSDHPPAGVLTLPWEVRQKSRFRACLDDGTDVGVFMPRGTLLRGGDLLKAVDGRVIVVQAAPESVSTAFSQDMRILARACYHLGNRHVPLQIGASWVRYLHDHVLDQMAEALELRVSHELAPFEPESGAYDENAAALVNAFSGAGHGHHHAGHHHHDHHGHD